MNNLQLNPPDFDQREAATLSLDKNVVVLAGAGTGKTTLLIDRLTLLLMEKEIPIERIVALTFTKKAAEEMRERLEERLRRILMGEEILTLPSLSRLKKDRSLNLAEKALTDIPKAQIGTIHSFAAHLLRLFPLQAGVDPSFREDEGTLFEEIFDKKWMDWLDEELSGTSQRKKIWERVLLETDLVSLKKITIELCSPLVNLNDLSHPFETKPVIKECRSELDLLLRKHELPARAPSFLPALKLLEESFALLEEKRPIAENLDEKLSPLETPPQAWKEEKENLLRLKRSVVALGSIDENFIGLILKLLQPLVELVKRETNRRGIVSFDGLLVFARELLSRYPDVRTAIKKRFDVFLVDEFQDTDPIQGEILFYLSENLEENEKDWRKVNLSPGRLFMVGDPKQSIYRFRGADVSAFELFRQRIKDQDGLEVFLTANFRSVPEIIDFVNDVFPAVMKPKLLVQPDYIPLVQGRNLESIQKKFPGEKEPRVEMALIQKSGEEKCRADEGRWGESQLIGDWISKNVQVIDDAKEENRFLRYKDIAILFRSTHAFGPLIEVFRQRNIPYVVEGEKSFYQSTEIVDFYNLLSCLANPKDSLALVGVLRSPLGGLTDSEILSLKQSDLLDFRTSSKVNLQKAKKIFLLLKDLSEKSFLLPLPSFLELIFQKTWILELCFQGFYGEQSVANLLKVKSLAVQWSKDSPLSLRSFVRRIRMYQEMERREGESPLADSTFDAVKIMTIHKAKGLEFPVVFLPNLSAGINRKVNQPCLLRDWSRNLVGIRIPGNKKTNGAMYLLENENSLRDQAEEVRVFYVALTRAKNKMFLLRSDTKESGVFSSFLSMAGASVSKGFNMIKLNKSLVPIRHKILATQPDFKFSHPHLNFPPDWDVQTLAQKKSHQKSEMEDLRSQKLILSPSIIMNENTKERDIDRKVEGGSEKALIIGKFCHAVLERWDFQSTLTLNEQLLRKVKEAASFLGLPDNLSFIREAIVESKDVLKTFFKSKNYKQLSSAKIVGREIPFFYSLSENKYSGAQLMRGVIDVIYEMGNDIVIADYKTNRVKEKDFPNVVEHYRPQRDVYCQALKKILHREPLFELIFLREGLSVRI